MTVNLEFKRRFRSWKKEKELKRRESEKFMEKCRNFVTNEEHLEKIQQDLDTLEFGDCLTVVTDGSGGVTYLHFGTAKYLPKTGFKRDVKRDIITKWMSDCIDFGIELDDPNYFKRLGRRSLEFVEETYKTFDEELRVYLREFLDKNITTMGHLMCTERIEHPYLVPYDISLPISPTEILYQRRILQEREPFIFLGKDKI